MTRVGERKHRPLVQGSCSAFKVKTTSHPDSLPGTTYSCACPTADNPIGCVSTNLGTGHFLYCCAIDDGQTLLRYDTLIYPAFGHSPSCLLLCPTLRGQELGLPSQIWPGSGWPAERFPEDSASHWQWFLISPLGDTQHSLETFMFLTLEKCGGISCTEARDAAKPSGKHRFSTLAFIARNSLVQTLNPAEAKKSLSRCLATGTLGLLFQFSIPL